MTELTLEKNSFSHDPFHQNPRYSNRKTLSQGRATLDLDVDVEEIEDRLEVLEETY